MAMKNVHAVVWEYDLIHLEAKEWDVSDVRVASFPHTFSELEKPPPYILFICPAS